MLKIKSIYLFPIFIGGAIAANRFLWGDIISDSGEILRNDLLIKAFRENSKGLRGLEERMAESIPITRSPLDRVKAEKAIGRIKDYSVKITNECGSGTGWFLDYEIPKKKGEYPLKWFLATNAHVVNSYLFGENPYGQTLPVRPRGLFDFRPSCSSRDITLFRSENGGIGEWILNKNGIDFNDPKNWSNNYLKMILEGFDKVAKNANHEDTRWNELSNVGIMYSKLQNPKLFYVPLNFLGRKWRTGFAGIGIGSSDYYKDFAVLEINFRSQREARRITGDLYSRKEEDRLNFFGEELLAKGGGDQLRKNQENYFTAGYPGNSYNEYKPFGNYSQTENTASNLSDWLGEFSLKNMHKQPLTGHVNAEKIDSRIPSMRLSWGGKKYKSWGYNYSLDNMRLGAGASGSLVTNGEGDVLGLYRAHDSNNAFGFVEPLRSEGYAVDSRIILPKYDLIEGVPGQVSSYRQQLEKYMPHLDTYLKNKWKSRRAVNLI